MPDLSEDLTLQTPALGIAHVVAEHFAGHEACAARRALQTAAEGYRARAQSILDSRGRNHEPLADAIWNAWSDSKTSVSEASYVAGDPRTLALIALKAMADDLERLAQEVANGD